MTAASRLLGPLLVAIPIVGMSQAETAPDIDNLLDGMKQANRMLNYSGIFVYQRGGRINYSMRIVHRGGESQSERLLTLDGIPMEVIREGSRVICILPEEKRVSDERTDARQYPTLGFSEPLKTLDKYYAFNVAGEDRVAGRSTWVVNIAPADADRYGYELAIDKETFLVLSSVVLDREHRVLEQVKFIEISMLESVPDEMLEPSYSTDGFVWETRAPATLDVAGAPSVPWNTAWLPRGFRPLAARQQVMKNGRNFISHSIYSDGLATVSVFVEEMPDSGQAGAQEWPQWELSLGATSETVTNRDDYRIRVLGEIPLVTARNIAGAVVIGDR